MSKMHYSIQIWEGENIKNVFAFGSDKLMSRRIWKKLKDDSSFNDKTLKLKRSLWSKPSQVQPKITLIDIRQATES
jgi:hypothetical protein